MLCGVKLQTPSSAWSRYKVSRCTAKSISSSPRQTLILCTVADNVGWKRRAKVTSTYPTKAALEVALTERLDTEVVEETEMSISGRLPAWLNGMYLKNGPGTFKGMQYVFDGYACITKVSFKGGKAYFSSRFAETAAWRLFKQHGRPLYREFGTTLPFHLNFLNVLKMATGTDTGITDNCSVNLLHIPGTRELHCITELTHGSVRLCLDTLRTLGPVMHDDAIHDRLTTGHPAVLGDSLINITTDIGKGYTVFRQKLGSNKREVITQVANSHGFMPAWVHQFPFTSNYIVIPEIPLRYSMQAMLGGGMSDYILFDWMPQQGTKLHIVRLCDGHVVTVDAPPFCSFHYPNAFETNDRKLCFDFGWMEDPEALHNYHLDAMRSGSGEVAKSCLRRMKVPLDGKGDIEVVELTRDCSVYNTVDVPTINPRVQGKPYRFLYGNTAKGQCSFPNSIAKFDLAVRSVKMWHEGGSIPTEAQFVGRPGAFREDDGVLLSHVSGADGRSYVLVLDARSFREVARVFVPGTVAFQYHGTFVWA